VFTFQFLNDRIDQNTNFAKLVMCQMAFFGITVNFIVQNLKNKHLVCLSSDFYSVDLTGSENLASFYEITFA
jgi:hypothetical protein